MNSCKFIPEAFRAKRPAGADGEKRCVLRLPIATKLVLSFLFVIILTSVVFSMVGMRIIADRVVSEAQEKVRADLNSGREIYDNYLARIGDKIRFVSERFFIKEGFTDGKVAALADRLEAIREKEHLDVLCLTDKSGIVLVRTTNPSVVGDDQSQDALVQAVLQKKVPISSTVVISADDLRKESPALAEQARLKIAESPANDSNSGKEETSGLMLKAAAPFLDANNNVLGVACGGVLLNNNFDIVDKIKQTVFEGLRYQGEDIGVATIFKNDLRISTNVKNKDGSRATGTHASEAVYQQVGQQGRQWMAKEAYVVNNWYLTAYEPIRDPRNIIIGMLGIGLLERKYLDIKRRTILTFLGITLAGGLVAMTFSYVISQKISAAVRKIVTSSEQIAHGNLDQKVEIRSNDEFEELAQTYNTMAEALRKRDKQLKEFATTKIMESERLAIIGQLAAGVAHEINNPLQGIVTYSHLLLERMPESDLSRGSIEKIVTQANRCRGIVRGLLDFARQRKPDTRLCSVNTVLQDCVSLVGNQVLFHNIEIVKNLRADLPAVPMDPSQIQQVFMNIIINAAEATTGNGRLAIATRLDEGGRFVEIEFADSGCGISEANLEHIFDPFFTTKDARHGTGLGLAISYGIVKEHKGTISVESVIGKGTTFTVCLPVTSEAT